MDLSKVLTNLEYVDNSDKQFLEGSLDFDYSIPTRSRCSAGNKVQP